MKSKLNPCSKCGKLKTDKELFYYVDGNNISITKNARAYCYKCYLEMYHND